MTSRIERARELQGRTKRFAIAVIQSFSRLSKMEPARILGRQLIRSGTSVAANYHAACRARDQRQIFISKISIVAEEANETLFWLEAIVESRLLEARTVEPLIAECTELLKMFSASLATAKANR
jgi:four helix bundle protein